MKDLFGEIFRCKGVDYLYGDIPLITMINFFNENPFEGDNGRKFQTTDEEMSELSILGKYVSEELVEIMDYVDHKGKPELIMWNLDGKRIDYVRLSPEHRGALKKLQKLGVVSRSVSGKSTWMYHFLSGYLISDPGIFCTMTLTAQTAYGVRKYLKNHPEFLSHFLDYENPWYGATFYSEVQGGSDLGSSRTTAKNNHDAWLINGVDKYFASNAGIADGAIITAKVGGGGVRSIGTFFLPYINSKGDHNFTIRRLKNKLGTIAVPSGEIELNDAEAYLLGKKELGIYYAMEILTISRIDDALGAIGVARKAFWEAYVHTEKRKAFGKYLQELPLMKRDLLTMEAEIESALAVSLYSATLFSRVTEIEPPYSEDYHYARFMTHIAKNLAAWTSETITSYSMEILGGIGFFEEFPMAKFHRDALVTSIWEGTSNIQSLDMLETIVTKNVLPRFFHDMKDRIVNLPTGAMKDRIRELIDRVEAYSNAVISSSEPQTNSKKLLHKLGELSGLILLEEIGVFSEKRNNDSRMAKIAEIDYQTTYCEEIGDKEQVEVENRLFSDISILKWMSRET